MDEHYYYLHTNGELIHKRFMPESDSPFVKKVWTVDTSNRVDAWTVVLEALALGAQDERIKELAKKWGLTYEDSIEFIIRISCPTQILKDGMAKFTKLVFNMDIKTYWEKVSENLKLRKSKIPSGDDGSGKKDDLSV